MKHKNQLYIIITATLFLGLGFVMATTSEAQESTTVKLEENLALDDTQKVIYYDQHIIDYYTKPHTVTVKLTENLGLSDTP